MRTALKSHARFLLGFVPLRVPHILEADQRSQNCSVLKLALNHKIQTAGCVCDVWKLAS